jgi:hypothetical protein
MKLNVFHTVKSKKKKQKKLTLLVMSTLRIKETKGLGCRNGRLPA